MNTTNVMEVTPQKQRFVTTLRMTNGNLREVVNEGINDTEQTISVIGADLLNEGILSKSFITGVTPSVVTKNLRLNAERSGATVVISLSSAV